MLILLFAGCTKPAPTSVAGGSPAAARASARAAAPHERREYSALPDGERLNTETHTTTSADEIIKAEALRGGPHGEARIFENEQERAELARGRPSKYMNAQFRYYLAGVSLTSAQEGGCRKPLLAVRLAVENLQDKPIAAIYGTFTFLQTPRVDATAQGNETVGSAYRADIIGPFSDKQGGIVYVTAYAQPTDASIDLKRWNEIVSIDPSRLTARFTPEVFYYSDGSQYAPGSGSSPAARDVMTCGGTEGASKAITR